MFEEIDERPATNSDALTDERVNMAPSLDGCCEQIATLEHQLTECKRYAESLLETVRPAVDEVIKLIAEQGSHAWRNERTLTAIFRLGEMRDTVIHMAGRIKQVTNDPEDIAF